eukprot:SM000156S02128  [mRNA]  locus=s156:63615:63887:- [translate_table: standard]
MQELALEGEGLGSQTMLPEIFAGEVLMRAAARLPVQAQAQQSIALQKAATARREEARRRQWAEASERARAWAERQATQGLDNNQARLPSS